KAKGAEILIGTASEMKKEFVEQQGMIYVSRKEDFVKKCKSLTNAKGVDHALDPVGGKHLMKSYRALSNGGKLYSFGASSAIPGKKRNILAAVKMWWQMPKFDPLRMMNSNKSVFGVHLGTWEKDEIMIEQMQDIVNMYQNGKLSPIIDSIFKLDDVSKAHIHMHNRKNKGKILLDCRN
ncbi:MAG: alcohol dehydrogenase, partial [Euryarchaeota archaeon]|nr:alcohol dehydrogenase [Euryarchaeota archaeon]